MADLLEGKSLAAKIRAEVARDVTALIAAGGRRPCLVAVLVGENPASESYVRSKTRGCEEAGIEGRTWRLPADVATADLAQAIDALNADPSVDGILVQLPLPAGIDERSILDRVAADKDVDGFHPENVGRLWLDREGLFPATPSGVMRLLEEYLTGRGETLAGRRAVVVGRSAIVGKPMAAMLLRANATVTLAHSKTRDLAARCAEADVLVAAIGRTAMIGPEFVRDGAIVIDVGINRVADAAEVERLFPGDAARRKAFAERGSILTGDVDFTRVAPRAAAITPVPGGVGLLTVAMVISNTLVASRRRQGFGATRTGT
jgi:methylenetetrahydrofolate dehydrogenase (NADP+)/methenyltetrahydrofolate cyclohydrolase